MPSLQTTALNSKRLEGVIIEDCFFTKYKKPLKFKKN